MRGPNGPDLLWTLRGPADSGGSGGSGNSGGSDGSGGSESSGDSGGSGDSEEGSSESGGGGNEGDDTPSNAERAVMVVSVLLTVAVFGFAAWQLVTASAATAPTARVIDTQPAADGDVVVTVELTNRQDVGLRTATVEAACTDPPVEVTFADVPVDGRRVGHLRCPPGTDEPNVSVSSWIER